MTAKARGRFVRLLQQAYSGELGAAIAYAGHATSVLDPAERERIRQIRTEELEHRALLAGMLVRLGGRPDPLLELRNRCVGGAIAVFCHIGGWYLPMYGAGWIECRNIAEYERAAGLAVDCGQVSLAEPLLAMAATECEHECFFRERAASHWLSVVLPVWSAPIRPPRALAAA
jgi:hypothetical protein